MRPHPPANPSKPNGGPAFLPFYFALTQISSGVNARLRAEGAEGHLRPDGHQRDCRPYFNPMAGSMKRLVTTSSAFTPGSARSSSQGCTMACIART